MDDDHRINLGCMLPNAWCHYFVLWQVQVGPGCFKCLSHRLHTWDDFGRTQSHVYKYHIQHARTCPSSVHEWICRSSQNSIITVWFLIFQVTMCHSRRSGLRISWGGGWSKGLMDQLNVEAWESQEQHFLHNSEAIPTHVRPTSACGNHSKHPISYHSDTE